MRLAPGAKRLGGCMNRAQIGTVVPVFSLVLLSPGVGHAVAQPPTTAFILDSEAPAVMSVDLAAGKVVARLALSGKPVSLLRSPDGARLVALDPGPGEDKREHGYKSAGKSTATIIDPTAMSIVGRLELGFGVEPASARFSPDGGRVTVLCPGYEAKNPAEAQVRELVTIDLATGREAGRLALEHGAWPIPSKEEQALSLIQGLPRSARFPFPQSRLWLVDLAGPSITAKLDMGTWSDLYTDGAHFYLLDPGKPDKSPRRTGTEPSRSHPWTGVLWPELSTRGAGPGVSTRTSRADSCSYRATVFRERPMANCVSCAGRGSRQH
jgi:hypothetical protein